MVRPTSVLNLRPFPPSDFLRFNGGDLLTGRSAGPRLEGEPVRALSGLLPLALHPGPVRGARRLRAAAADLRPEGGVHPGRRPAALLRAGAGAGAGVAVGLLKVNAG